MQTCITAISAKSGIKLINSSKQKKPFFAPVILQPKLTIGPVDDPYEHEADATAEKVMSMSDNREVAAKPAPLVVQKKCAACEEEELNRKEDNEESEPLEPNPIKDIPLQRKCTHCHEEDRKVQMKGIEGVKAGMAVPSVVNEVINSKGVPLDAITRAFMEPRFGYDFGNVRLHNDSIAHQSSAGINALAYTHGNHIVFAAGKYQPNTVSGKRLLAHELTHVLQQNPSIQTHQISHNTDLGTIQRKETPGTETDIFSGDKSSKCPKVPTNEGFIFPDPPCPIGTHIGSKAMKRFNFCADSSTLIDPNQLNDLDKILETNFKSSRFLIHGYASLEGNKDYNFVLACRRANTILEALSATMRRNSMDKSKTEQDAEISRRIETASQGPTKEFGNTPEANRIAILYLQEPLGEAPDEPACKDAPKNIGDVKPDIDCDQPTMVLEGTEASLQRRFFFFCTGSDVFLGETAKNVKTFAHKQAASASFTIHGFASEEGTKDTNKRLSCHRALRVARELMNAGVLSEQIKEVSGIGATDKFAKGNNETAFSQNRVVVIHVDEGRINPLNDKPKEAKTAEQKAALIKEAAKILLSGQYNLGADAYLSFWTCGTTQTVRQAVTRLHIQSPLGDKDELLTVDADGVEEGIGVNTVRLSNTSLRADNPLECIMGRLIDMAFHHAVINNDVLTSNKNLLEDDNSQTISRLRKDKKMRHEVGLHLVFLAGFSACLGTQASAGKSPSGKSTGVSEPIEDDPLQLMEPPLCAAVPQPSRLLSPPKGAKKREKTVFKPQNTDFGLEQKGAHESIRIAPKKSTGPALNQNLTIKTAEASPVIKPSSTVSLVGNENVFNDYEIGFMQSILDDLTIAQYITGHEVVQKLPVPTRAAEIKGNPQVPLPWMSMNAMQRPDPEGQVKLNSTWQMDSNFALTLGFFNDNPIVNANFLDTLQHHTKIAIWLVARRLGGPLDRFTVIPMEGKVYEIAQNIKVDFKRKRGNLDLPENDPLNQGEVENVLIDGVFRTIETSDAAADFRLARFGTPTAGNIDLNRQFVSMVGPGKAPSGGEGMDLPEYMALIKQIVDTLKVFTEEEIANNQAGKDMPRLGYVFDTLTITVRINPNTGRMLPYSEIDNERENRSVLIDSPGIGKNGLNGLSKALGLRLEKLDQQNQAKKVILNTEAIKKLSSDQNGTFLRFTLPPLIAAKDEKRLIEEPGVKEQMALLWACTELLLSDDDPFNKGGLEPREFALVYWKDRDHTLHRDPEDAVYMGKPLNMATGVIETNIPCGAIRASGMIVGNVHTHPFDDKDAPKPSPKDQANARSGHCGRQFYIISQRFVFEYFSDDNEPKKIGTRESVLPKGVRCDTKAKELP